MASSLFLHIGFHLNINLPCHAKLHVSQKLGIPLTNKQNPLYLNRQSLEINNGTPFSKYSGFQDLVTKSSNFNKSVTRLLQTFLSLTMRTVQMSCLGPTDGLVNHWVRQLPWTQGKELQGTLKDKLLDVSHGKTQYRSFQLISLQTPRLLLVIHLWIFLK